MTLPDGDKVPERRSLISRRCFLRAGAGGVAALGAVSWHSLLYAPTNPVISLHEEALINLPPAFDGLRVLQMSDLHHSSMVSRRYLEKCVRMGNELEPDLIFLTGDFITRERERKRTDTVRDYVAPLTEILGELRARISLFAVLGNHDVTVDGRAVAAALEKAGIRVLRNDRIGLGYQGERLPVVGLADYGTEYPNQRRAFAGIAPDEPALIMMHNPDLFGDGMNHRNGLIFAGHTHGGQVLFPFFGPYYVPSRYGDRFLSGRFQKGNLTMLVNRGLGLIYYPIRINCRPEFSLVTLRRGAGRTGE
jgi:uncharacterized protein